MKIKKKEYQKQLDDHYWEGVNAGMKLALRNPETAKEYVDHIEVLRLKVEKAKEAFQVLSDAIHNYFKKKG